VEEKVDEWRRQFPDDNFFLRLKEEQEPSDPARSAGKLFN